MKGFLQFIREQGVIGPWVGRFSVLWLPLVTTQTLWIIISELENLKTVYHHDQSIILKLFSVRLIFNHCLRLLVFKYESKIRDQ
jgi:hypothetical protein